MTLRLRALHQIGLRQAVWYLVYRGQVLYAHLAGHRPAVPPDLSLHVSFLPMPKQSALAMILGEDGQADLNAEAEKILAGQVRLFGGGLRPLDLTPHGPLQPWTDYERGRAIHDPQDIKFIWEPARFGWAFTLGRAFHLTADERYAEAFWKYTESFWETNPSYLGPNWISGQEVALRLMALVWAGRVFATARASTPKRMHHLAQSIAEHAHRIPLTLAYARAQNNNHLLSEVAGLLTAAAALPQHPHAARWRRLGSRWWRWGLQHQIAPDGAYIQHSTNYHRLMLQLALWVQALSLDSATDRQPLARATQWLLDLCDPHTGRVPNFGPNDGAYVFPCTVLPFHDHRPVLQAAARAFLGHDAFPSGPWDEMALWFPAPPNLQPATRNLHPATSNSQLVPSMITLTTPTAKAHLRVARFTSRPGHADQLHLDLWWHGLNIAQDAGTFLYNAHPPWNNALTHAEVHNTLTLNDQDQMTRTGKFLYLDWAQAEVIHLERAEDGALNKIVVQHNGYRRLGATHRRTVTAHTEGHWVIEDEVIPSTQKPQIMKIRLHWLLPDWPWKITKAGETNVELQIQSPPGWISLAIHLQPSMAHQPSEAPQPRLSVQLVRAGELLFGTGEVKPTWGWISPTYGQKQPALSISATTEGNLPVKCTSTWTLPH